MESKQYTVKSSGTDATGKKVWGIFDKESNTFNLNYAGGRFDLQAVAGLLNTGKLSGIATMAEITALTGTTGDTIDEILDSVEDKALLKVVKTIKAVAMPLVEVEVEVESDAPALIGYMRISTTKTEQKFDRQEDQLQSLGCSKIYSDKVSGTKKDRAGLAELLNNLKKGDTVVIVSIDRLSRSTKDLLEIVETIKSKGAYLKSINDSWLDTTENSPMADFLLTVMGALGQMERELIVHRVNEGLAVAKKKGVKFGRPRKNVKKIEHAMSLHNSGTHTTAEICEITGVSRATFFRRLKELREVEA